MSSENSTDRLIYYMQVVRIWGRLGGKLAIYAIIAWLFLRAIEQTEAYSPLALIVAAGFLALALFRLPRYLSVAERGEPAVATIIGKRKYAGASASTGQASRFHQLQFVYHVDGQEYRGRTTFHSTGKNTPLVTHAKIDIRVDPDNPRRAYWVEDLPGHMS